MTKEMLLAVIVDWFESHEHMDGQAQYFDDSHGATCAIIDGRFDLTALADRIIEVGMMKPPIDLTGAVASEGRCE